MPASIGSVEAELARDARRPRAAAEHEFVAFDLAAVARRRRARTCLLALDAPARDFGVPDEFDAVAASRSCICVDEAIGREVTVLRKVHAARDVHPDAGIERGDGFRVEHLRIDSERAAHFRRPAFLVERVAACGTASADPLRTRPKSLPGSAASSS